MSKPLTIGGFEWINESEFGEWRDYPCVLEVDLAYPKDLHNSHNNYSLPPEQLTVGKVKKTNTKPKFKNQARTTSRKFKAVLRAGAKTNKDS